CSHAPHSPDGPRGAVAGSRKHRAAHHRLCGSHRYRAHRIRSLRLTAGREVTMTRWALVLSMALWCSTGAAADAPDAKRIGDITGLPTEVAEGVVKVTKPRGDINAAVDGRPLMPFQGITSWAAFQQSGNATMVMGDIVLLEHEANPALSAALD